jgi:tetratricopeptide (TPR) repeat protein
MADTPDSPGNEWRGTQSPCVYCGQVIDRASDRCPHCRTSFSLAVRKASREVIGPWYYLDQRNPSGRGVTFETLIKMIEKGRLKPDSIVRGPTTHQDWMFAAEAPRLAKYLGMCPHCFAAAKPEDTFCTSCQLNMNQRPAEPRPGVPADLVKAPVFKDAYEIEKQLAAETKPSAASLAGEPLDSAAPPAPMGASPAAPRPAARPEPAPTATAAAAVAALADSGSAAGERPSRVGVMARSRKPSVWLVLIMTWVTLIVLVGIAYAAGLMPASWKSGIDGLFGGGDDATATAQDAATGIWLKEQLALADQAERSKDYATAIRTYQAVIERTGDKSWESRIEELRRRPAEERKARLAKLEERLKLAENLAQEGKYDDALAALRSVGADDRQLLASVGVSVDSMEKAIQQALADFRKQQQAAQELTTRLAAAAQLRAAGNLDESLAAYRAIAGAFDKALVAAQIDMAAKIAQLRTEIAAANAPTPPVAPPVAPPVTPPTTTTMNPQEAATAVADILAAAAALEKGEKFADALAKLEEIRTKFEEKYWPEQLEERIKQVKAKKEALEFFGMDGK